MNKNIIFWSYQKAKIFSINMKSNNGVLCSDDTGEMLLIISKPRKGVTPPWNEVQICHKLHPRFGGVNRSNNARVVSFYANIQKELSLSAIRAAPVFMQNTNIKAKKKKKVSVIRFSYEAPQVNTKHLLNFPIAELKRKCVYSSVAHAVGNFRHSLLSAEQPWDGMNYCFMYANSRGTITFDEEKSLIMAAFFESSSLRIHTYPQFCAIDFYSEANDAIKETARTETLEYRYLELDDKLTSGLKQGRTIVPVVTTAMWSEGDALYSPDDKKTFIENGGSFIEASCIPFEELIVYWNENYQFTDEEAELVRFIFELTEKGENRISRDRISAVASHPDNDADGYDEFINSLKELKIEVI